MAITESPTTSSSIVELVAQLKERLNELMDLQTELFSVNIKDRCAQAGFYTYPKQAMAIPGSYAYVLLPENREIAHRHDACGTYHKLSIDQFISELFNRVKRDHRKMREELDRLLT